MNELEVNLNEQLDTDWNGPIESHCKKCGKEFYPTPHHIYKDNKGRYCCWTCFNHRNDDKVARYKAVECLYSDGTVAMTFQSINKAIEWIGGQQIRIKEACLNGTQYKGYFWRYKK